MADINDNTINITISAPSADSNTISVVNPALKNNVVVNDARITPSERAKLAGIEAGADVTDADNVFTAGAVMTTGNQSIDGTKTLNGPVTFNGGTNDPITIQNNTPVNFNTSSTTFGPGANVEFSGPAPKFKGDALFNHATDAQVIRKDGTGDFQIFSADGGDMVISSDGGGETRITSSDGDIVLNAGDSASANNKVKLYAREGIELHLSSGGPSTSSPFKIIDDNPLAGVGPTDIFSVDRKGDVVIKNANGGEVFKVAVDPNNSYALDFIEIGGSSGYKFPKPEANMIGKTLVVGQDGASMEFLDAATTTIDGLDDVDISTNQIVNGQILVWKDTEFIPGVPSISSVNNIGDVDTQTTSPQVDYALVWTSNNKWEPRAQIDTNTDTNTTVLSTDATPTLGADLDVSTYSITTTESNGGITIRPDGNGALTLASASGTGNVIIGNQNTPSVRIGTLNIGSDQSVSASNDGNVLTYDSSSQKISLQPPVSTVTELDHLTDVNLSGGVSQGDVMQAEANGTFSPQNALQAFMSAAYLLADNANAPLPSGALGDFNGDGTVDADDLTLFLGMFGGSSVFDGNTNITFSDISPTDTVTGAQALINSSNYNTQTVTTFIDQLFLTTPSDSNSVDIYNWTVNTTSQTDHNVQFDTTGSVEMSDWFSTAKLYFQDPSEMVFDIAGFEDSTSFNFCLYLEVSRVYPSGTSNTTDLYPLSTYLSVPTVGTVNLNQNGQIVVDDVFSQNAESVMPRDVFLRFYVCPDPSSFEGSVFYSFSNLKLKVAS
tara:strand:+ start:1203 stop:3536 length:2334 start_codon:yes stop_codon:yes gene_type:complete